ncbi:sugar-binding transcriptional regulator [Clostridium chauvoei]|uniref:sugar-binding transcriptional regulator n=1 Tax=Clostridium chauvoei TaxID=46867 RepID=UPI001C85F285|nr:sugar-binding transcriptional regulator [Clostridium chauvoei]MBX7300321.1 sugar-binding transcriptional regulator [Clostridium chauvoei]MBX7322964.1 sugar-binding transcriptional regulator [Clostridium chauvoei]MBX7325449.1 sugar-binding transcriptional regulator [Clostridium chauvoei]
MDNAKQELSVEVARLYYQLNYSQQQIASRLGISRPTISRLLKYAKEKGYININIIDPFSDLDKLACKLKERYALSDVRIVLSSNNEYESILESISKEAAEYLEENIKDGDIIGVGAGTTMNKIGKELTYKNTKEIKVVQLQGLVTNLEVNKYEAEIVSAFAKAFQAIPKYLPLPGFFDNNNIKQMVEKDCHIQNTLEMGTKANIAIFTVGNVDENGVLFNLDYLSEKEKLILKQKSVGDVCLRFFDEDGKICDEEINNRTMSISLDSLKEKEKSILVAGGEHKVQAIKGVLKGKISNILITDQYTAKKLLE